MTTTKKTVERQRGQRFIVINIELREDDARGLSDGFSITAELYEPHGNRSGKSRFDKGLDADSGGCLHDEIRLFAPELVPLINVHLADLDGTPMHAVANGWYFYSGEARRWEESHNDTWSNREGLSDAERGARSLNIPASELPEGMNREEFEAFAESLRNLWAQQAQVARALLETL
jgi:hypothetical protein